MGEISGWTRLRMDSPWQIMDPQSDVLRGDIDGRIDAYSDVQKPGGKRWTGS